MKPFGFKKTPVDGVSVETYCIHLKSDLSGVIITGCTKTLQVVTVTRLNVTETPDGVSLTSAIVSLTQANVSLTIVIVSLTPAIVSLKLANVSLTIVIVSLTLTNVHRRLATAFPISARI